MKNCLKMLSASLFIILLVQDCARKSSFEAGAEAIKKGDYARAIKPLNEALALDSLNPETHYNLSLAYAHLDSMNKSYAHFIKIVEMGSPLKDNTGLRLLLINALGIEPFPSSLVPMGKMHQFKGSFGPDGERIAVAAAKISLADIYIVKIDGKIVKRITSGQMNTDPAFSPKGDKIAYSSGRDGDDEIYIYDIKNDDTEKLTDNTYDDYAPAFSPDGNELVYTNDRDGGWEIYKIDLRNKLAFRLTKNKFWEGFPAFTPDGKSIVFASKRNGSEDIYIMKSNGGGEQLLYATKHDETEPYLAGEELFFRSNRDGEYEIYRINIKTKELLRLTNNSKPDYNPRVSRDATRLLVARQGKKFWELYFINMSDLIPAEVIAERARERL